MKKATILFTLLFLALVIPVFKASSIVFVPPVIYIATLSLGSFLTKIFIFIAFYLTSNGLANSLYLGKPLYEITKSFFSFAWRSLVIILSAAASVKIFGPLNAQEALTASLAAGVISLIVFFLASFREYHFSDLNRKTFIFVSNLFFSLFIVLVAFISVLLSLETRALDTGRGAEGWYEETQVPVAAPSLDESEKAKDFFQENSAGVYENDYYESEKPEVEKEIVREYLWFYPQNYSLCQIYFDDIPLFSEKPALNCYYYRSDGRAERIFCPIPVSISDIPQNLKKADKFGNIFGQGSCKENYSISLRQEGFNIKKQ